MRCTTKIRCLRPARCSDNNDSADGESESGAGTASRPGGLSTATTESSSYTTASSREKRRGGVADEFDMRLRRSFFTGGSRWLGSWTVLEIHPLMY